MTPLQAILASYRATSETEREKGTYFEELIRTYFRYEASYADLYSDVWLFADWAKEIGTLQFGISAKDTGIVNDANLWATETIGDAKYPLELFLRVITVSLETRKIVNGLPKLAIEGQT